MPSLAFPNLSLPFFSLPSPTLPYLSSPYLTSLPFLSFPFLALRRPTFSLPEPLTMPFQRCAWLSWCCCDTQRESPRRSIVPSRCPSLWYSLPYPHAPTQPPYPNTPQLCTCQAFLARLAAVAVPLTDEAAMLRYFGCSQGPYFFRSDLLYEVHG